MLAMRPKKYTTKELTQIAGTHDVFHCGVADCKICKAYWQYAKGLREQSKDEAGVKRGRPKKQAKSRKQTTIAVTYSGKNRSIAKLVNEYGEDITYYINQGFTVRRIAYELDHKDAEIVQALDYLKLSPKTRSELNIEAYRDKLVELVREGLSVKAIANCLHKNYQGIRMYLRKYELPLPDTEKITFDRVVSKDRGQSKFRYFDDNGDEVKIEYVHPNHKTA
ncbi:hypothetical protein NVV78_07795 [Pediococcus ethanolidurans]|uniref:hypothetical protein n=1 Tax=Pediococcus ethanolidurans TaxID=319653 RepID=UPI001C1ED4A1|nr:hypothetical protein [Pediococcus ethanolidurans]MBU7563540.1 hypothetical protein [Pediococcus ethanolidurans]MCV3315842.1 hypothetical protein [Pediococcus ethanolidurans]MCV3327567.1 hypothetical protein [Pediococcus ethanolidurans]